MSIVINPHINYYVPKTRQLYYIINLTLPLVLHRPFFVGQIPMFSTGSELGSLKPEAVFYQSGHWVMLRIPSSMNAFELFIKCLLSRWS